MAKVIITIEVDEQDGVAVQTRTARAPGYVGLRNKPASGIVEKRLASSFSASLAANSVSQGAAGGAGPGTAPGPHPPTGTPVGGRPHPPGGQIGSGDGGQIGSGDGGQIGSGDGGQIGSGDGGQIGSGDGGQIGSGNGTFSIQHQQQLEWCWAAVAVSVDKYFNPASTVTQCQIASNVTGEACCGPDGAGDDCNQPEKLQPALRSVNRLRSVHKRALQFPEVQREIDAGRPVAARIGWASGGGHFVVLDGYRILPGAVHLHVSDPLNPSCEVDFDEFTNNYQGDGTWDVSYLLKNS